MTSATSTPDRNTAWPLTISPRLPHKTHFGAGISSRRRQNAGLSRGCHWPTAHPPQSACAMRIIIESSAQHHEQHRATACDSDHGSSPWVQTVHRRVGPRAGPPRSSTDDTPWWTCAGAEAHPTKTRPLDHTLTAWTTSLTVGSTAFHLKEVEPCVFACLSQHAALVVLCIRHVGRSPALGGL